MSKDTKDKNWGIQNVKTKEFVLTSDTKTNRLFTAEIFAKSYLDIFGCVLLENPKDWKPVNLDNEKT